MTTFVLWGGPEDGKEVEVLPNSLQIVVDSPSERSGGQHRLLGSEQPPSGMPFTQKALYVLNRNTKRFEWKEYL